MITLVPHSDMDPCPRVEITVDAIVGAETITVERQWDGSTEVVRKARRADMASPFYVVDFEVPLDTDVTYVATGFSSLGAVVEVVSAPTAVPWVAGPEFAIMQAPLAPKTARAILLEGAAVEELAYSRDLQSVSPIGTADRILFGDRMRDAEDVNLSILARDGAESVAVGDMIRSYSPLLIRSVDPIELPRLAYVAFPATRRRPIERRPDGWNAWRQTGILGRPPAAGIAVPQWTYDDVKAMYAGKTYDEVKATRPGATYLDWVRDPRP